MQARLREIDSGTLSEKDFARLKEIAREDPFVADALEGFNAHPHAGHTDHLIAIEEKIKVYKRERRRWLVPNLAVTAIAACLMLLIGAYAVIMRMDNEPSETTFVFVDPDSLASIDAANGSVAMESSQINEEEENSQLSSEAIAPLKEEATSGMNSKKETSNAATPGEMQSRQRMTSKGNPAAGAPSPSEKADAIVAEKPLHMHHITGSIVDAQTNLPIAFSPYLLGHTNKLSFTDVNGNFEFDALEETIVINLKHAGYEERTLSFSTDKNVTLVLHPKPENESTAVAAETSVNQEKYVQAYFAFRDYISGASLLPLGTGITPNGKTVIVEFTVGQNGRPTNFKIDDASTGEKKHIKEALRLIDSGPEWTCPGGEALCRRSYTFYFQ